MLPIACGRFKIITVGQFYGLPLWHERIFHAIQSTTAQRVDLSFAPIPPLKLETLADRQAAGALLERDLKYLTVKVRDILVERLEALMEVRPETVTRMTVAQRSRTSSTRQRMHGIPSRCRRSCSLLSSAPCGPNFPLPGP